MAWRKESFVRLTRREMAKRLYATVVCKESLGIEDRVCERVFEKEMLPLLEKIGRGG